MANASRGWTEESRLTAAIIAGIFIVYALGASRTIYVGDSGELATAAAILGIPHPSGYPLYVLLGKLFVSLFSLGSIPFRLSIFSAVCAAASCGLLFRILRETEVPRLAGLFAALLLAFSPSFWAEANIQRVYSLNALLVTAATLFALRWVR